MSIINRLNEISAPAERDWVSFARQLEFENTYLKKSAMIAASVLFILREKGMTKAQLANLMGVKAQYVSRIVKGRENLTIETISKIERALEVELFSVIDIERQAASAEKAKLISRESKRRFLSLSQGSLKFNSNNVPSVSGAINYANAS